jgi:hypothetical protein
MVAWEYHKTSDEAHLDELGRQGWELVAVTPSGANREAAFYFKRPALNFREQVTEDQKHRHYTLHNITPSSKAGEAP